MFRGTHADGESPVKYISLGCNRISFCHIKKKITVLGEFQDPVPPGKLDHWEVFPPTLHSVLGVEPGCSTTELHL